MERSGRLDPSTVLTIRSALYSSLLTAGEEEATPADVASSSFSSIIPGLSPETLFRAAQSDVDFFDILAACDHYGVTTLEIDEVGTFNKGTGDQEFARKVFAIGSGLTSEVILHVTGSESKEIVPQGTIIALKTFTSSKLRDPHEARAGRQRICKSLLREIHAFSHPLLRGHANIVQLLFVALTDEQRFPSLAMELGDYGSLDHIIRAPGPGLSVTQKRHIMIDMALGLQAIHGAGFVHGDLKPDNVIVFEHPSASRQVVAKITDFGGSVHESSYSAGRPSHHTPVWSPREVLVSDSDVDWESVDVYSYGVIVACLWAGIAKEEEDKIKDEDESMEHDEFFEIFPIERMKQLRLEEIIMLPPAPEDNACLGTFLAYQAACGAFRTGELTNEEIVQDIAPQIVCLVALPPQDRPDIEQLIKLLLPTAMKLEYYASG
ncbi:serine/threonine protein kinase [Colletotrichum tofieldiae]|uniref:Serine/threonine protein kinase n=1 Tax=Colletotrichum tofieldiae TaxID=708197 RepID=A0A161YJQ4_9PEZI|nr:serine/threonine protein kinase [Colletotrichum tofieldiae]GKT64811.1 serine/threonine protein kinase [Colletotrichum tofieldiae]GKT74786.1 serine/threonine protein kinase [Colletotrichum tofieldiae]